MDYFRATPLKKWNRDRMKEYFARKGIQLTRSQLHSGAAFSSARLRTLCRIYGTTLGEQLYLIIRDRLEREEEVMYKKISSTSPSTKSCSVPGTPLSTIATSLSSSQDRLSMSDLDLGAPAIPINAPEKELEKALEKKEGTLKPELEKHEEPEIQKEAPNKNEIRNGTPDKNEVIKKEIDCIILERQKRTEEIEDYYSKKFIKEHPPILWQQHHLQYFLKILELPAELTIPVDDFIFLSQEEFDTIFPGKGASLYASLRSRFVNPNIKKIPISNLRDSGVCNSPGCPDHPN